MKKIYFLSTCDTCRDIMKNAGGMDDFEKQDIKTSPMTEEQLFFLKKLSGSYETLFSKRAKLYHEGKLKDKDLQEDDYKKLLLENYTFLKRPVIVLDKQVFIGNEKQTVKKALHAIHVASA